MARALLRCLAVGDDSLVALGIRLNIAIEFGKIEASAGHSLRQMIAKMPIACAHPKNSRTDFFQ